jgi:hypothetical protein
MPVDTLALTPVRLALFQAIQTSAGPRAEEPVLSPRAAEKLVLTMPPDPALARLTRRVSFHFFKEHGITGGVASRRAQSVERACRALLGRPPAKGTGASPSLILVLTSGLRSLEVVGRIGARGAARKLASLQRPASA